MFVQLAHGSGTAGSVSLEFLLMGVFLVGAAFFVYRAPGTQRWVPVVLAVIGIVLSTGAFVVPRLSDDGGASEASVEIVRPSTGAEVSAGEPVRIEASVRNGDLATSASDEDGGHLHLYVDGRLEQMPYGNEMEVSLKPGRHEITVEYVDHDHQKFDPRILERIEVVAR